MCVAAMAKLAALVPKPGVNLTRYHGVLAPNSQQRVKVTPARRGKAASKHPGTDWLDKTPEERHRSMTWMQRLKRVFQIDIKQCEHCGGQVKVIASIEDPSVIEQILKHLKQKHGENTNETLTFAHQRAPPPLSLQASLID